MRNTTAYTRNRTIFTPYMGFIKIKCAKYNFFAFQLTADHYTKRPFPNTSPPFRNALRLRSTAVSNNQRATVKDERPFPLKAHSVCDSERMGETAVSNNQRTTANGKRPLTFKNELVSLRKYGENGRFPAFPTKQSVLSLV